MTNARYVDRFSIVSLGGRAVGRRFNVSMVSLSPSPGRRGRRERSNWSPARPPPDRNGPPADTRQIPTILYQLSLPRRRRLRLRVPYRTRQTSNSRRPRSAAAAVPRSERGNINIQFLLLIVIQIIPPSSAPRVPTPDGWMDGSSMDGRYVGNGARRRRRLLRFLLAPPPPPPPPSDIS